MKKRILPTAHLTFPLAYALCALLSAPAASAANRYWDGGTVNIAANGNTASAGGAGTWNTTLLNWDAGAVPHVAWNNASNDIAFFAGTAGAVTLGEPITAGGLSFSHTTGTYTLQTGELTLAAGSIVKATAGGGTASLATLTSADTVYRFQNTVTTNNLANSTVFTVSVLPAELGTANPNSVEILGNGASTASPVVLGASGQTLAYTGTTTVADKAVFGVSGSSLALTDSSITMGTDSIIMRTGQNPTGTSGMGQTFLNKIAPTSNAFGIVSNNGGTSNPLNLTNFPNASLALWDNAGTQTFGFTGAITAGSNGYRFGSTRVGNIINIGGTSGTAAVTANILTGTAGLELITGSLGNINFWGGNTYSGTTINNATGKTITLRSALAMQNSAIDTSGAGTYVLSTGSTGTGGNSGATVTTPTIGGLIGSKNLLTNVIATTGYNTMTTLTLNPGSGKEHTYSGVIANSTAGLALTKSGAGTQILSGLNTFAGNVTVSGGTLVAAVAGTGGNSALGTVVSTRTINVNTGGTLRFDVGNVFNNNFSSNAVPTLNIAGGTVTNGGTATNSALGNVTLNNGTLDATVGSASGYGSWNLNGTVTSTGTSTISSSAGVPITLSAATGTTTTFDVSSGTLNVSAVLGEVTAVGDERVSGLVKNGVGTLALTGINTYTGNTAINVGALSIGSKDSLPGHNVTGRYTVASGATLAIQNTVPESDIGVLLGTGNFQSGSNLGFDTTAGDRTVAANLTDSANGPLGIVKLGTNILTLTGTNTYTGATTVLAGGLYLGSTSSLPNWNVNGAWLVTSGGSLVIPNTISEAEVTTLLGTTNIASGGTLLFDTGLGDRTYVSALTNSAQGLVSIGKIGSNTLSVSGSSTYTGATKISSGTLALSGGFAGPTGSIIVSDTAGLNATLNLTGGTYALASTSDFRVGFAPTTPAATGTVNQTGGTLSFAAGGNQLLIGNGVGVGNTGTYHLSGGSITIPAVGNRGLMLGVNTASIANFLLSGSGALNMTTASGGAGDATLMIGRFDSASDNTTSTFTQTGGTANIGTLSIGGNGATSIGLNSTLNLTGGTFSANAFPRLSLGNTNTSTINIGGTAVVTLPAFPTARGTSSTATINFDGGTLKPLTASAAYMGGLTNAFIKAGGAKIDTTNGSITITQPLLTDEASLGGGLTKAGANMLTLTGANTYTGTTTVSAGALTVTGTIDAASGLAVSDGASFNFLPASVGTSLALSTLSLSDGSSISLTCDAATCDSLAASGAATVGSGVGVGINLIGTPTLGVPYTVLTAASGLNNGAYVLLNPTDYYGTITKSPTAVTVTATTTASPLTVAYWKGGYPGFSGVWAVSNGLSGIAGLSNWTVNAAGTVNTAVVPGVGTDVFLSASGAGIGDQNIMTLGANMAINSLTINDASSPNTNPVTLLGTDGATLTLAASGGTGIMVNAGSGAVTLGSNIALGATQTWTNHSANPLTVTGTLTGNVGFTKAGAGLVNITGATGVSSTIVEEGTLFMGAQTGLSTTTTLGAGSPVTLNGSSNLIIRRSNVGAGDLFGAIDGTGSLTLLGDNATSIAASDYSMNNASSYSGGTTIIGARAAPTLGTAFGSGPVTVGASGGIFVNSSTAQTFINDFTIGGLGWNEPSGFLGAIRMNNTTISGNITLTADTRITGANTSTLSGVISGNFSLNFFEDTVIGTISLAGDNTYTGTTTVNSMGSGTTFPNLVVSSNTALGTTDSGTIVVGTGTTGNGSQLTLANGITVTDEALTLDATAAGYRASLITASNGIATWDGNVVLAGIGGLIGFNANGASSNLTIGSSDADTVTGTNSLILRGTGIGTVHSALNQTGGIFKTDTSSWTITSNNNGFTGLPTVAAGTLVIGSIADAGVNSALGAGTAIALGQNSTTVGTLQFTGGSGGSSNRALSMNNGTAGGNGVIENAVAGQTLTLSGELSAVTPTAASSLTLTGAGDGVLSGGIVGTPLLTLGKSGGGSWTLSGAITYRGATNITEGTLNFSASSVFDSTTSVGMFTVNGPTAVANIAGTYNVANGNGNAFFEIKGGGTLNFNGNSTLTTVAGGGFRVGEASTGTFNMTGGSMTYTPVSGSNFVVGRTTGGIGNVNISAGTLTVTGAGGFVIANDGSTSGTVTVGGTGTLDISATTFKIGGNASATAATVNLNTGGTFVLGTTPSSIGTSRVLNFDGGTLKASANITIPAVLTAANVKDGGAVFDSNGNTITVDQPLLNFAGATTDSLTKKGTGTLILTGVNTYTGATTVNAGTLQVNSPGSLATSSAVTVNDSATIGGTGTIGGSVTVAAAGNVTPGASAGTLTITGALDLSAMASGTGKLAFELDTLAGTNDKIVAGTVAIGSGTLGFNNFDFTNVGGLEVGTYKLITSSGLTGTLDASNLTGTIGAFSATLKITGNDIELVVSSANAYASWALAKGLNESNNGKSADPDGDGKSNLTEFALDGNPLSGANDGKVVGKVATVSGAKVMTLTLPVRTGAIFAADSGDQLSAMIDGIHYRIEGDGTLTAFADAITEVTTGDETAIQTGLPALSAGWTYRTFRAPGTVPPVPKAFLRAKVSETP